MNITLHQTHHTLCDFQEIFSTVKSNLDLGAHGIHLFPESFLCGYPLQDLCLRHDFIQSYHELLTSISAYSLSRDKNDESVLLLGGLKYELDPNGLPLKIYNGIYELKPGHELKYLVSKILLPNYDIFDEKKYFTPGKDVCIYEFQKKKFGLLVCEDMWPSSIHPCNPIDQLTGQNLDAIFNLSASPFNLIKNSQRQIRAKQISNEIGCPFVYVNRVGGEDEILFDGESFIVCGEKLMILLKSFVADEQSIELPEKFKPQSSPDKIASTWEGLFAPNIKNNKLNELSSAQNELCIQAIGFGLKEYARKNKFNKFSVALSGGIDSALVLTLTKLSGLDVEALYMPSEFSTLLSKELSIQLCENLNVPFLEFPIKEAHNLFRNQYETSFGVQLHGLADENIQSRLRGALIYSRSNQIGSMVINTSNKSELAVGYSTQYGDSVGAISLLGDLFKSEVFKLAKYINQKHGNLIPQNIITRAPSAELRANQKDEDSLPPYEILDTILEGILSFRLTKKDLVALGFEKAIVEKVLTLYKNSEYKRSQFCPIIKLKPKSFGFGYRIPLSKKTNFFM